MFEVEALFERSLADSAKLAEVAFKQCSDLGRDRNLLDGAAELFEDVLETAAVVIQKQVMRHGESITRDICHNKGIPVTVAADP